MGGRLESNRQALPTKLPHNESSVPGRSRAADVTMHALQDDDTVKLVTMPAMLTF